MSKLFAMKLKYFRELNGFTQSDLAKFAGTTRNMISNYEIGRSEPNFEILCELARVLGCEITDLVGETGNPVMQEAHGQVLKRLLTDDEAALIQAYREADPVYQTVALDILRTHKRK